MTIAALEAVLKLYRDPDRLAQRLPTLRLLTRGRAEIQAAGRAPGAAIGAGAGRHGQVQVLPCRSQIGSGSLPVDRLDSVCLAIGPAGGAKRSGSFPERLAAAFRALPVPVIGRSRGRSVAAGPALPGRLGRRAALCQATGRGREPHPPVARHVIGR